MVILTCGILFFGDDTNHIRLIGMCSAFFGIVAYTHIKIISKEEVNTLNKGIIKIQLTDLNLRRHSSPATSRCYTFLLF